MGVHGLWRLIEPSGKTIPLEALENKILAIDISIWLHQAIKGFQDSRGAQLPNAHLLGIYHRLCKLLYFRIRPIFVFDGGVPALKKQTIAKRNQQKIKALNEATNIQSKLINTILKYSAVKKVLSEKTNTPVEKEDKCEGDNTEDDLFKLPETRTNIESCTDSSSSSDESCPTRQWDLHTIDEKSEHFRSLPADVRHDILTEIMETRKQSSWGRIHELPKKSKDFSNFQMKRLLKRYSVQISLEEAQKEMGGHSLSLGELEALLTAEGIVTPSETTATSRIASSNDARYLLIKDVKKAMKAEKQKEPPKVANNINSEKANDQNVSKDKEFENDLAVAIQLSLEEQPSTSTEKKQFSFIENFNDADFESDSEADNENILPILAQAKGYMMEYTGLTPNEIAKIINNNTRKPKLLIKEKNIEGKDCNADNVLMNTDNNASLTEKTATVTSESNNNNNKESNTIDLVTELHPQDTPVLNKDDEIVAPAVHQINRITEKKYNIPENIRETEKVNHNVLDNNIIRESVKGHHIVTDNTNIRDVSISSKENENTVKESIIVRNILNSKEDNDVEFMSDSNSDYSDFIEVTVLNEQLPQIDKNTKTIYVDDQFNETISNNSNNANDLKEQPSVLEEEVITTNVEAKEETNVKNIQNDNGNQKVYERENKVEAVVEPQKTLTIDELNYMESDLALDQQKLMLERNTKERMAGNISDQMYQEAQELLELFGVPYIIAPMEAEAQCAFLNEINLTDGTITDDSDIWLFGGQTVYKNFFNQKKHVMEFRAESIEHHFKLTREQMILLALLVGSDYTLGIQGIGPVTALEILASFPSAKLKNVSVFTQDELLSGLVNFKKWLINGKAVGTGRTSLRSKLRNINISDGFPNSQVVQAYLQPKVDTCAEHFTWGKLNVGGLTEFAREKFGWSKLKSEEILKPVTKKLEQNSIQKSIKDYFVTKHKISGDLVESKMSKRVKMAVKRIENKLDHSSVETESTKSIKRPKRTARTNKIENSKSEISKNKQPVKRLEKNKKEIIPQKERDKLDALKNKLKAIEVFRKSKQGPGFVKKRQKLIRELKESNLSESSSSDE